MEVRTDSLGQKGVFIGFLNQSDIPPEILPVSDLGSLDRFVSADALAKYEKLEFGE